MSTRDDGRDLPETRDRPSRDGRERSERRDADAREADRRKRPKDRERPGEREQRDEARARRLPALQAARAGLQQLAMVTGREPQGVVFLVPEEDGWRIGIEIVEDRRIPSSTDVLGLYEATVDEDGELTGYSRTRRYRRGKSDAGEMGG